MAGRLLSLASSLTAPDSFETGVFQLSWRPSRRLNSKSIYARICLQKPSVLVSKMATCGRVPEKRPGAAMALRRSSRIRDSAATPVTDRLGAVDCRPGGFGRRPRPTGRGNSLNGTPTCSYGMQIGADFSHFACGLPKFPGIHIYLVRSVLIRVLFFALSG